MAYRTKYTNGECRPCFVHDAMPVVVLYSGRSPPRMYCMVLKQHMGEMPENRFTLELHMS